MFAISVHLPSVFSWGRLMNLESRVEMLLGEQGPSRGLCPLLPLDFLSFLAHKLEENTT